MLESKYYIEVSEDEYYTGNLFTTVDPNEAMYFKTREEAVKIAKQLGGTVLINAERKNYARGK